MEQKNRTNPVHVREILRDKSPGLARLTPGFIIRYISRMIHEDEINQLLAFHGDKYDLDFLDAVINDFNVTLLVKGEENLPEEGRYIFRQSPFGRF